MKLGYTSIVYLVLLSAYNMIMSTINKKPLIDFILYVGVFLACIFVIVLSQHYKKEEPVIGFIYLILGVVSQIVSSFGVGLILICYSYYYFGTGKKRFTFITIVITISVFVQCYIMNFSVVRSFNFFFLYIYIFYIYYITFHPKPIKLESIYGLTPEQAEILQYLVQGFVPKEIGDKLDIPISANAVYKRVAYMREKHGYRTTEQMIYDLAKNGRLRQLS